MTKKGGSVVSSRRWFASFLKWWRRHWLLSSYLLGWFAYFSWFWRSAITVGKNGELLAGHINMWGDWAVHFTMGSGMAYRQLLLESSPLLINQTLSYPFFANLLSAVLIRLGVPFFTAFVLPSWFFSLVIVAASVYFFRQLTGKTSLALIASTLLLLNGGLGFVYFIKEVKEAEKPLHTFINPPHEYTHMDNHNIKWINMIDSMVIPQRAFNHGFGLTLLALGLVLAQLNPVTLPTPKKPQRQLKYRYLTVAAVILGCLPLIHTHSLLAAFCILACWGLGAAWTTGPKNWWPDLKPWIWVAGLTGIIAGPLWFHFYVGHVTSNFIQWFPGWYAREFQVNWLSWWLMNWGVLPLLAAAGWLVTIKHKRHSGISALSTWLPFWLLFAMSNLWLWQPYIWDNTKVLIWAAVGFSGLTAIFLQWLWQKKWWGKTLATVLFVISIASGTLDAYRSLRTDLHRYPMYSAEELQLAEWSKKTTPVNSIWLTSDQHNHWLYNLTGRQAVMVFRGWLWTHGYNYRPVEQDLTQIWLDPEKNYQLLKKYRIGYVVVGPSEQHQWHADPLKWLNNPHTKLVRQTDNYWIFEVLGSE